MVRIFNKFCQLCYVVAYRLFGIYYRFGRCDIAGVFVGVNVDGHLLLIKNSYRHEVSLPGGGVKKKETILEGAVRELWEEVGILCQPDDLVYVRQVVNQSQFRCDRIYFYDLILPQRPQVNIDNREVIWAEFLPIGKVHDMDLSSPVQRYLLTKGSDGSRADDVTA